MWVTISNGTRFRARAFRMDLDASPAHGTWDTDKSFEVLPDSNTPPVGVWSDGNSAIWVMDPGGGRLRAYNMLPSATGGVALTALTVNDGTQNVDLRPDFHLSEVTYHTSVSNSVTPVTISATAATATVEYVDADGSLLDDADTGTAGHQVNVSVGITAIGILVTAPDGTALIHTINVERDSALFGGWTPTKDVHSLDPVADPYVQDIWSNGTTVWVANKTVANQTADKLHAYTLATSARDKTKDISLHVDNRRALGIWSDETTIWVTDSNDNKLYAYALSDGTRQDGDGSTTDKEFDLHVDNDSARAIWSNGTHIWVVDDFDDKVYAYALSDGTRQDGTSGTTNREFDLEHGRPEGVWSNGTTMWVADSETRTLHAYTLANGVRYATRDVSLAATNRTAAGIWSDGTTIWVGDAALVLLAYPTAFHRIYSYNLPPYLEGTTTLSALTISPSPAIASFAPDLRPDFAFLTYSYRVAVPDEAELVTVNATPSDSTATVVYRDADGETLADADAGTTGHQVNVAVGTTIIEIVVTNGSETLSYDVLVERDSAELYGWTPTRDVNTLLDDNLTLAADRVRGVWGNKTTLYVTADGVPTVFAYARATGARDTSRDIATNQGPRALGYGFKGGIWSDDTTMWVLNYRYGEYEVDEYGSDISSGGILYAFTLKDGIYDADKGIPLHLDTYRAARGVWSDGTTVRVADWSAAKLFAYALVGGARKEGKDITLHLDNAAAQGNWSDGATIWVADWDDNKFYAYQMTAGTGFGDRDRYKEFDLAPDNMYPRDVWSDGETLYVPDAYGPAGQKLYSYYIAQPPNSRARGRPSITGIAVVDETLTADLSGISDANGLTRATYTYQWVSVDGGRDTDIPGATGSTYKVKQTDLRKRLKVKVSLIDNNRYQEGPLVSQAVGPVEGVIPPTIKFFSKNGTYQDAISVTWQSVRGAAEYKLEMQKQGDEDWTRITRGDFDRLPSSSDNRFLTGIAKDLECGEAYDFRISLRGDGITFASQFGPYAETTVPLTERVATPHTDCPKPERPTNLRVNGEPQCATLNWTPPTGNDYTGVRIRRLTIPPSTAGEQDWEVIHERLNDSRTSYQDCKTTTSGPSGYGNWGKEYSYSVYYIKQEIKDNGEGVTVESPRASSGLDLYGPTHPPGSPRNVRLTRNNQSRRTLAWEAPPHYGLILEQVLERRRGSLTDPWLTGYMVERRQYTVRPGAKNPDNYSVQFPEYEDVTLWSTTLTVGQNADDSRRGFLVPGGMNVPLGAVSTPGFSYASGTTTVEQLSVEQDQMAKLIFELTPRRFDSTTDKWTLVIDDTPFPLKDSTFVSIATKQWGNSGISWAVGQTVSVQLIEQRTLDWEVMRSASDNNTSRSFTDDENAGAKTYVYRVRAVNAAGDSSGYWQRDWLWMAEEPKP